MLDHIEFLSNGITEARSGNFEKAIFNLRVAAQIDPENPRAWLWLASVLTDPQQQYECLQRVAAQNPKSPIAGLLIERLTNPSVNPQMHAAIHSFECRRCGGHVHFDPDRSALCCQYCGETEVLAEAPVTSPAASSALPGDDLSEWVIFDDRLPSAVEVFTSTSESGPVAVDASVVEGLSGEAACEKCGATIQLTAKYTATRCPFCGSVKVLRRPLTPGQVMPQSIVPFELEQEAEAAAAVKKWAAEGWFAPDELQDNKGLQIRLVPVYLPFWAFRARIRVYCGRDEPMVLTDYSRVVRWRGASWYEHDFDPCLIYASKTISGALLEGVLPFDLSSRRPFHQDYLAGWQAETYQIALADAEIVAKRTMREAAIRTAVYQDVIGDSAWVQPDMAGFTALRHDLTLLPVWTGHYRYKNQWRPVLVNGQSGVVSGERPVDKVKQWSMALITGLVVLIVVGLIAVITWLLLS
jgi:predicted RNA-binding Zn-ribbon protein involved in translation (DUF1610 family)